MASSASYSQTCTLTNGGIELQQKALSLNSRIQIWLPGLPCVTCQTSEVASQPGQRSSFAKKIRSSLPSGSGITSVLQHQLLVLPSMLIWPLDETAMLVMARP
jgi:hypothetical protein